MKRFIVLPLSIARKHIIILDLSNEVLNMRASRMTLTYVLKQNWLIVKEDTQLPVPRLWQTQLKRSTHVVTCAETAASAYTTQSSLTYPSIYTELHQDFLLLFQQNNVGFGISNKTQILFSAHDAFIRYAKVKRILYFNSLQFPKYMQVFGIDHRYIAWKFRGLSYPKYYMYMYLYF